MKSHLGLLFFCLGMIFFGQEAMAQKKYDLHWVGFTDKAGTPYSVFHPQEYLSPQAIERRQKQGIQIDSTDLPVSPVYIQAIEAEGLSIHLRSKWFNGVVVVGSEEEAEELKELPFVAEVFPVGMSRKKQMPKIGVGARDYKDKYGKPGRSKYYGTGDNQIKMLSGHYLHAMGCRGDDMRVAVMDGGFEFVKETPAFDSMFINEQLLATYDFVEGDEFVFESSTHGADVLSTIASNLPYIFVGTAPDANFYLFKTEDEKGEFWIEQYTWVAAAEYADSAGVDVVNSSLGYHDFNDDEMDFAYVDLDGKTTAITQAAEIAASKGMIIVTSAGNAGNDKWKHITAPADAPNALTVGAVDRDIYPAKFTSQGFGDRDYIKPDVVARGHQAVIAYRGRYDTRYQYGTSFSSPIMAGAVTSLWQAYPDASAQDIMETVRSCGTQYENPDTVLGYGAPNLFEAYQELSGSVLHILPHVEEYELDLLPNDYLDIFIEKVPATPITIELYTPQFRRLFSETHKPKVNELWHFRLEGLDDYPSGVYLLYIKAQKYTRRIVLVK